MCSFPLCYAVKYRRIDSLCVFCNDEIDRWVEMYDSESQLPCGVCDASKKRYAKRKKAVCKKRVCTTENECSGINICSQSRMLRDQTYSWRYGSIRLSGDSCLPLCENCKYDFPIGPELVSLILWFVELMDFSSLEQKSEAFWFADCFCTISTLIWELISWHLQTTLFFSFTSKRVASVKAPNCSRQNGATVIVTILDQERERGKHHSAITAPHTRKNSYRLIPFASIESKCFRPFSSRQLGTFTMTLHLCPRSRKIAPQSFRYSQFQCSVEFCSVMMAIRSQNEN